MNEKELTNEELSYILDCMRFTGICPSSDEKEYLREAAERLREIEDRPKDVTKEDMLDFYQLNDDFKRYVDACCVTYGKSLDEILELPITKEYYLSMQKGGCNE